jgi:hypothetical protein
MELASLVNLDVLGVLLSSWTGWLRLVSRLVLAGIHWIKTTAIQIYLPMTRETTWSHT